MLLSNTASSSNIIEFLLQNNEDLENEVKIKRYFGLIAEIGKRSTKHLRRKNERQY